MRAQNREEAAVVGPSMSRRIMVLYRNSLLAQGLETLLRQVDGLEVTAVDLDRGQAIVPAVEAYQPHVVLWEWEDIPTSSAGLIFQMLEKLPSARIFCFTSALNGLTVYAKRDLSLTSFSDLVREVQS